jgi:hypothetical protein
MINLKLLIAYLHMYLVRVLMKLDCSMENKVHHNYLQLFKLKQFKTKNTIGFKQVLKEKRQLNLKEF